MATTTETLIERKGFTVVALEADWPEAQRLDRYVRGTTVEPHPEQAFDRQRVQPSGPSGHPLGRTVALNERARYELRRMAHGSGFVVWKVVLLK